MFPSSKYYSVTTLMTLVERLVLLKSYMKSTYNFAKWELQINISLLSFDEKALRKSDKEKLENALMYRFHRAFQQDFNLDKHPT